MGTPATIGINNNLTASQTSITLGTTNDEAARRVEVENSVLIKEVGGNNGLDNLFLEVRTELLVCDIWGVLSGDDNGVDAERNAGTVIELVLDGDLCLGIGTSPGESAITTAISQAAVKSMSQLAGQWHAFGGLICSITKHNTLITSANVLDVLTTTVLVHTLRDIRALLLNGDEHVAGLVIKTFLVRVITNLLDAAADNLLVVNVSAGSNLTKDHNHTSLASGLASDAGLRVLLEASVEDGIRHLIADLVGMAFADRLGGEEESVVIHARHVDEFQVEVRSQATLLSRATQKLCSEHERFE
eukprot:m.51645 g.51645  ORF g.51645 m.51645 type:complete len:302 (+) comp12638_c1_seq1:377-1282(+)